MHLIPSDNRSLSPLLYHHVKDCAEQEQSDPE